LKTVLLTVGPSTNANRLLYIVFVHRGFYARKQLLLSARLSHRNSIRPSVRLSHGWISQKRCKLGLPNFHCRLSGRL